ncbi:MAG: ankyrin repeat domain-containing protein, partial [Phycisphaerales bacterium]|nr:ankyrin repeat domain-containing protein [Phycisphaerales bacterium]
LAFIAPGPLELKEVLNRKVGDEEPVPLLFLTVETNAAATYHFSNAVLQAKNEQASVHAASLLVQAGANLLATSSNTNSTVLHRPLLSSEFLDFLATEHPDSFAALVNTANTAGMLPLDVVLERTDVARTRVADVLIRAGGRAQPSHLASHGPGLLREMSSQWQYTQSVGLLLELGVPCNDLDNKEGLPSPLLVAIKNDVSTTVSALLAAGAIVSEENFLVLLEAGLAAVAVGSLFVLSRWRSDLFAAHKELIVSFRTEEGESLLHAASAVDLSEFVPLLAELGLDVNLSPAELHSFSDGGTPLHIAAQKGHLETIKALLALGADVNSQKTFAGNTPCHMAAAFNRLSAVELLLTHKPRLDLFNEDEETAEDVARENCPPAVQLFRRAKAALA